MVLHGSHLTNNVFDVKCELALRLVRAVETMKAPACLRVLFAEKIFRFSINKINVHGFSVIQTYEDRKKD